MDLKKFPLLIAIDPFSGIAHKCRVIARDKARKVATVVTASGMQSTVPFSYFVFLGGKAQEATISS
jgi:formyltetrahydrofolate synthetase